MKLSFSYKGFTLIELMTVVVIMSILMMIAIPSYQYFMRKSWASKAQQAVQDISMQLDRYKSRNFNYQGFSYTSNETIDVVTQKYTLSVVDGDDTSKLLTDSSSNGRNWVIKADSLDNQNYSFLMTSTGLKCKNITPFPYTDCGEGSENW